MEYYLPITINDRRLHICHLKEQSAEEKLNPIFSFVINNENNASRVFGIDADDAKLISTEGYDNDVKLSDLKTKILFTEGNSDSLPTYSIILYKGKKEESEKNGLASWGDFTNSDKHFRVEIDKTIMAATTESFVVEICYKYKDEKQEKKFAYAFKIHLYTKENLIEAAMDFGSEASQIFVQSDGTNMKLVSSFEKFHGNLDSHEWGKDDKGEKDKDYWQGIPSDDLYKSVFFIHTKPLKTTTVDKPNTNNESTFIQTLIPKNYEKEKYKDMIILPNLKLVELLSGISWTKKISFKEGNPFDKQNLLLLSSTTAKNGILRMVLNNFLHCLLNDKLESTASNKRFIKLLLLMPNVYYQQKVYSVIKNLYEDFEKIKLNEKKYEQYAGIEIQMLSESDAAFMGAKSDAAFMKTKTKNNTGPTSQRCVKDGYFLIIDAGKGTTDFSILKQQGKKRSVFDSFYRNGIPASGHFLTYAFYEAAKEFFNSNGISLKNLIENAERSTLIKFMTVLEQFKIKYNEFSFDNKNVPIDKTSINTLDSIVTFLDELAKEKKHIPQIKKKVKEKVRLLVDKIQEAIKLGIKQEHTFKKFEKVLLTGRGFLFSPFQVAVSKMLSKNQWINENSDIHAYKKEDCNKAKTICLKGSFETEKIEINNNSELIGRPYTAIPELISKNLFEKWWNKLAIYWQNRKNRATFLDKEFFYNGVSVNQSSNLDIFISGRKIAMDDNKEEGNERRVYFTGENFIIQSKDRPNKIIEDKLGENLDDIVKQTLFPYYSEYPDSFNNETINTTSNNEIKQEVKNQEIDESVIRKIGNIDA